MALRDEHNLQIVTDATIEEEKVIWKEICELTRLASHTRMAASVTSSKT